MLETRSFAVAVLTMSLVYHTDPARQGETSRLIAKDVFFTRLKNELITKVMINPENSDHGKADEGVRLAIS